MIIDTVFFDRVIRVMETNHQIARSRQAELNITEAWIAFGDQLINQCKEMLYVERYNEERDAVFNEMAEVINIDFNEDMFNLSMRKTLDSIANDDYSIHED